MLHLTGLEMNLREGRMFENVNEAVVFASAAWHRFDDEGGVIIERFSIGERVFFGGEIQHEFTIVGLLETPETFGPAVTFHDIPHILFTDITAAAIFDRFPQAHGTTALTKASDHHTHAPSFNNGYNTIVFLSNPDYFEPFRDEIIAAENPFVWVLPYNNQMAFTVQNFIYALRGFSLLFIYLTALLVTLLSVIATVIMVSGRKYDIAVLRSIGMGKGKIIFGLIAEKLIWLWGLFIPAFIVGLVIFITSVLPVLINNSPSPLVISPGFIIFNSFMYIFIGMTMVAGFSLVLSIAYVLLFKPLKIFNKKE
jgi:hypothetical protein